MKIALVSPYDYLYPGGVNNHIHHLLTEFRQRGHNASVIATIPSGKPVPAHTIPLVEHLMTFSSSGSLARINLNPKVLWQIRDLLRKQAFDIVHIHNPPSPLVSIGFLQNRFAAPNTAFVGTFHQYRSNPDPTLKWGKPFLRRWISRLDGRIAVSEAASQFNQQFFPGSYQIIPNGVDVARFALQKHRSNVCQQSQPFTLLFVGRLEVRKGFPYLLAAFKHIKMAIPEARLVAVGPAQPETIKHYQTQINENQLTGVEIIGEVCDAELPTYYQMADIFCAPSVDFESFGIVLLEAMAAGRPIVASDIPGYHSVMKHGHQGLFTEPKNVTALADAIITLSKDRVQRQKMGQEGRKHAQAFDWRIIGTRVLDYYTQILTQRRKQQ
ncbi:MAG: glycosyltransferase family 4 protein [Chloroflexota bacterium]